MGFLAAQLEIKYYPSHRVKEENRMLYSSIVMLLFAYITSFNVLCEKYLQK